MKFTVVCAKAKKVASRLTSGDRSSLLPQRTRVEMSANRTAATFNARPTMRSRARDTRSRVVVAARDAEALAPPSTQRGASEVFSIAAKPTKPAPAPVSAVKTLGVHPAAAFGAGFIASAAIIKAHIKVKGASKLRKRKATLRYFDARGAAEVIRTIFAATNVDYEDYRYTFSMDAGQKPKICEQHGVDKDAGVFDANLKRLPILEFDGQRIGQSRAIERFVAKDLGLMGKGKIEEAEIDAYCEHIRDLREAYQKVRGNPFAPSTPEIDAAKEKWYDETMKQWMEKIENITCENGYAVGNKLSLADIVLYCTLTQAFSDGEKAMASYANCPKISAIVKQVGENEGVINWLATRPDNKF